MARTRVCMLGNSHLASLRLAWNALAEKYPAVELTFFGAPGGRMQTLQIRNNALESDDPETRKSMTMTSGGLAKIIIGDYDVFVLHGLLGFWPLVHLIGREKKSPEEELTKQSLDIAGLLAQSPNHGLLVALQSFGKPVFISVAPNLAASATESGNKNAVARRALNGRGQPTAQTQSLLAAWKKLMQSPGYIAQPEETVCKEIFTFDEYAEGAIRLHLGKAQPDDDRGHMNQRYGELVLNRILARCLDAQAAGAAPPAITAANKPESKSTPAVIKSRATHPYMQLPEKCHWNRSVASRDGEEITQWYERKFRLDNARIATAGSCFAQHIGRRLRHSGFAFVDTEPAPAGMPAAEHLAHGYGMYSARYGNVYTPRQLLQLFERAYGEFIPAETAWKTHGGFVDPFRPSIQPQPFATIDELIDARDKHLAAVRNLFEQTDVFVFTLGLTEAWLSKEDGAVYPIAPGVAGGEYDTVRHQFINFGFRDVWQDLKTFVDKTRAIRPKMRFLLTVSPVPLMATATGQNVVVATQYSKSVLRAVAGEMADRRAYVDYFPSFEIINSHVMNARFYEADKRGVIERGVDHVMKQFFAAHTPPSAGRSAEELDDEVVCDEALLAAFGSPSHATPRQ